MSKPTIKLQYCTSCNYVTRALWIAAEVLPALQYDLAEFTLVPGDRGIFDVWVGDLKVYSKGATGRFPDPDELKQAIFDVMENAK